MKRDMMLQTMVVVKEYIEAFSGLTISAGSRSRPEATKSDDVLRVQLNYL